MPENEEHAKRSRARACDACRKKKAKCDRLGTSSACTLCTQNGSRCSFLNISNRSGTTKAYAEKLEERLKHMQTILERHSSKPELTQALGFSVDVEENDKQVSTSTTIPAQDLPVRRAGSTSNSKIFHHIYPWVPGQSPNFPHFVDQYFSRTSDAGEGGDMSEEDDDGYTESHTRQPRRFHGRTSGYHFANEAQRMAGTYRTQIPSDACHGREWPEDLFRDDRDFKGWNAFPPPDLLWKLVDNFFRYMASSLPFLHRPTLEAQINDRFHERERSQAQLLLMICATASPFINDPRVYESIHGVTAPGYQYFSVVQDSWSPLLGRPALAELQTCALMATYCTSIIGDTGRGWIYLGTGVRIAVGMGAHRKSSCPDEMWKRTFWTLLFLDRCLSTWLGRPCMILEEDVDLDLPVLLPDEDQMQAASMELYNSILPMAIMKGAASRVVYSVVRSPPAYEAMVIMELEKSVQKWRASLPERLRWDPNRSNSLDFEQSARLHMFYCHFRILIYHPFSQTSSSSSSQEHSRNICVAASRECIHVMAALRRREIVLVSPALFIAVICAVVLLTTSWMSFRDRTIAEADCERSKTINASTPVIDPSVVDDIQECLHILRLGNKPWCRSFVGRYLWVLRDLAAFAGVPLPEPDESDSPLYPAASAHPPPQQPYHAPFPYPLPQVVSGSEQHSSSHPMHREATFSQDSLSSLDGYILGLHRAHSLNEPNQSMPDSSAFDSLILMPSHPPIHHTAAHGYQNPPATSRDQVANNF